jgi:hypothetical protein
MRGPLNVKHHLKDLQIYPPLRVTQEHTTEAVLTFTIKFAISLGHYAIYSGSRLLTFRRNILPPSSGQDSLSIHTVEWMALLSSLWETQV